ncbi:MAG: cupin domain-containing protein [candidate division Zixibacteria bacterium]|nr:cupin domain-containing protein [candidate division Zixibacteria bacterium]
MQKTTGKPERNVLGLIAQLRDYFSPRIIGEVDDVYVKITKIKGDDVPWHAHDNEDEMFFIMEGSLVMEVAGEESFALNGGDFYIVKKGTQHRVSSVEKCTMILVEGKSAKHTGNVQSRITKSIEEQSR